MSRAERRALKRHQKTQLKEKLAEIKAQRQRGQAAETSTVLLIILAVLLPPVAVLVHQGEVNDKFWISLLLTLLFWIPGVIYALITIFG
ncbi:YqaE/Pmp3 family membrane protein [Lewinella sp. W8]|nr:YqaE/Pmp3 family membrane protein [Lewinella sp. W8]